MGTNYYLCTGKTVKKTCSECGHQYEEEEKLHVGKSSFGRYFSMQLHPSLGITGLSSWKKFIEQCMSDPESKDRCRIENEYGDLVEYQDLIDCITRDKVAPLEDGKLHKGDCYGKWDIVGEKGLVYSAGADLGEDGLYVKISEEFS